MKTPKLRKTGYKLPVRAYAELYAIPYATIANCYNRKWPLDDPKELLARFEKAPGPKTNLTVLRDIVNAGPQSSPSVEPETETEIIQLSMALAGGLMDELDRLKKETASSYKLYIAEQRPADRMARQKIWLANSAALRQLAKEAPKAEREAKNVLVVSDVESTWSRALKEFKTSIESLGRRVSTLALFSALDPIDVEEAISKETVVILTHLEAGGWIKRGDEDQS